MKNWYIEVTKENIEILNKWRKTKCSMTYYNHGLCIGEFVLSKHWLDNSFYWTGDEHGLISDHPGYQKIDLETFLQITNMEEMPDFTIKGTKLPVIPRKTEYRVVNWNSTSNNSAIDITNENFISYGNKIFKDELYVLTEYPGYAGKNFFMFKLSDIQKLWKEQNLKTTEMKKERCINSKKERCINSKQAQSIIDIACSSWKPKLAKLWAIDIVVNNNIIVTEAFYNEMRNACTAEQNLLFDQIFGKDVEYPKEGTPCLVRNSAPPWSLRYADGNGEFYNDGRKSGYASSWSEWMILDINNLPVNN